MQPLKLKKGSIAVYLVLLVIAIVIMLFARGMAHKKGADNVATTEDEAPLRVAIQISPLGVNTYGDTLGGFYYDMVNQMAARTGREIKIDGFAQVAEALKGLDDGRYDIVIADIPVTTDLEQQYAFTKPIYTDRQVLVQRRDSTTGEVPITSQAELRGATVHIPSGSPMLQRLRNLSHELGDTIYVVEEEEYGPEQMMLLTALGEMPNVVVNEQQAMQLVEKYPQLDASLPVSFNQFQSWAVRKSDTALLDSLNKHLGQFMQTPAFDRLVERYFAK